MQMIEIVFLYSSAKVCGCPEIPKNDSITKNSCDFFVFISLHMYVIMDRKTIDVKTWYIINTYSGAFLPSDF